MTPTTMPNDGGTTPPPTDSIAKESNISSNPPSFLSKQVPAHAISKHAMTIVKMPATIKLGITVTAGSPAKGEETN
jgi:hypothetical protein